MKAALVLAAAGLAAASPLAAAPQAPPNLSSFQLRARTPSGTGPLEGTFAAELRSTSDGPTIVVLSNDTTLRLVLSTQQFGATVNSPPPAAGAKPDVLFYKNVSPGANIVPMQVGTHAVQGGFQVTNRTIDGVRTEVMELGTSDTLFNKALGCPVTVQSGSETVQAHQLTFWSSTAKKPAGCELVTLVLV